MKLISRSEAKRIGLKRYFTGAACKHGHVDERTTANGSCLECSRLKGRARDGASREKRRVQAKEWRENNASHVKQYNAARAEAVAEWVKNNKERKAQKDREWVAKNRERSNAHKRKHRAKPGARLIARAAVARRRARMTAEEKAKRVAATLRWHHANPHKRSQYSLERHQTVKQATPAWGDAGLIRDMYMEAGYFGLEVDHIVPLKSPLVCGLHWEGNLQLLTRSQNASKRNFYWPDMPGSEAA